MQETKLKSCPFCGGMAMLMRTHPPFSNAQRFFVSCAVCGVETPRIARNREEAKYVWNRRAADEQETNE